MVDFVGRSRSMLDDMQQWGQYFGEADARAQTRWQQNELRNRYNEANRYNREGAVSDANFYAQNADQFQGMDDTLGGLRPQNAPAAIIASAAPTGDAAATTPPSSNPTSTPTTTSGAGLTVPAASGGWQDPVARQDTNVIEPLNFRNMTTEEGHAVAEYWRATGQTYDGRGPTRAISPSVAAAARVRLRAAGLDVRNGGIVRITPRYSDRQLRFPSAPTNAGVGEPSATAVIPPAGPNASAAPNAGLAPDDNGAPLDNGLDFVPNTTVSPSRAEPPDASAVPSGYQGTNDTSRALRPTREMRLIETSVQDSLRRANLAAQHGDRAGAQTAFAQAMQGQAAYLQQSRSVLYRAASGGSLDAMATLLAEFNGYPPGTVRLQPTNEQRTRFNLQIQNNDGQWVTASEVPRTRDEMLGGLLNLIDAEGAQARTEANTELYRAQIAANADITVATIQQRTAFINMLSQAQLHQMDNAARAALQAGQGELHINQDDGSAYLTYSEVDANGRIVPRVAYINQQDVQTPSTDGRRTTRMPVMTRVTGTPNTSAGAQ